MKQGKVASLEHGTAPRKRRDCSNPDGEASGASPRGVTWFCNKCRTHRAEPCSCNATAEAKEPAADRCKAAEGQAFADKLAKRPPPNPVERAEIERARKRTKARAPRIVMHVEDRGIAGSVVYPAHSDEEGHDYRLADAFGTRSLQFVRSISDSSAVRSANEERETLPVTSNEKGTLSLARRRTR